MNTALNALCEAIKKVCWELKPKNNPLSFVILTGKNGQGKSAILNQSPLKNIYLKEEYQASIFYNQQGIILELGDQWIHSQEGLLKNSLKQLNRCNKYLKISGLALCVGAGELYASKAGNPESFFAEHIHLLQRFSNNLTERLHYFLIVNQLDTLAGFSEFYQDERDQDIAEALGFSLNLNAYSSSGQAKYFKTRFDLMIENLGQNVIRKVHPARSHLKRTLIREFPLQLYSLRQQIFALIQQMAASGTAPQGLYFCSAVQGGSSVDQLHQRIQHEFALTVPNEYSQATNYRAFFIQGMIENIQKQCLSHRNHFQHSNRFLIKTLGLMLTAFLLLHINHHIKTNRMLDNASKELIAYESQIHMQADKMDALVHLSNASQIIKQNDSQALHPSLSKLQLKLEENANRHYREYFLPDLKDSLEQVISNPGQSPLRRYQALKVYLMLSEAKHANADEIKQWFKLYWKNSPLDSQKKKYQLLQELTKGEIKGFESNPHVIRDARNYLNALPLSYFYYSLAKTHFDLPEESVQIKGFHIPMQQLPGYYTKAGYHQVMQKLPAISKKLAEENWVLNNQLDGQLEKAISEAYHFDYVNFWQTFLKNTAPMHFNTYRDGRITFQTLKQQDAFQKLIALAQMQTTAEIKEENPLFNQLIASQFTDLNLINKTSLRLLNQTISENEAFFSTLSVIDDQGKTAFNLTKSRFLNQRKSDPVSMLYGQAAQLPKPVSDWVAQLADDSWTLLVVDARQHVNRQWQQMILPYYQNKIENRYPLSTESKEDISLDDFNQFFASEGLFNGFSAYYVKPFLNTNAAEWKPKTRNGFIMPFSNQMIKEMMRANIISHMFFPNNSQQATFHFSLEKINLDPVISQFKLSFGSKTLVDNQSSNAYMRFHWPEKDINLSLDAINGNHYELAEKGIWAIFKLMDKVNIIPDKQDSASLEILFEINANSGRYLLRSTNLVNPFTPGVFHDFRLDKSIV